MEAIKANLLNHQIGSFSQRSRYWSRFVTPARRRRRGFGVPDAQALPGVQRGGHHLLSGAQLGGQSHRPAVVEPGSAVEGGSAFNQPAVDVLTTPPGGATDSIC